MMTLGALTSFSISWRGLSTRFPCTSGNTLCSSFKGIEPLTCRVSFHTAADSLLRAGRYDCGELVAQLLSTGPTTAEGLIAAGSRSRPVHF